MPNTNKGEKKVSKTASIIIDAPFKGRCPHCDRRVLTYKRDRFYFCHRCDRDWNLDTGKFQSNWAFDEHGNSKLTPKDGHE